MYHTVLAGDSIVDHAAHVTGGADVRSQLEAELTPDWCVTLRAVGGHRTSDVAGQLHQLPSDTSHLAVSVGGNDALEYLDFLARRRTRWPRSWEDWRPSREHEFEPGAHGGSCPAPSII